MKEAFEHLARAKGYFHRHEVFRALASLGNALKLTMESPLLGTDRMRFAGAVTEVIQLLNRTEEVRGSAPEGFKYAAGKEKALFAAVVALLRKLQNEAAQESEAEVETRKLRLDRHFLRGSRLLKKGAVADALASFKEAAALYVDEHALFTLIGMRLVEADQPKAALPYLMRAMTVDPGNDNACLALAKARLALGDPGQALETMHSAWERFSPTPDLALTLAEAALAAGEHDTAASALAKALELDPLSTRAARLKRKLAA